MKIFELLSRKLSRARAITLFIIAFLFINNLQAQSSCSLGDPVFIENFGAGSNRLGPSLNQDPNTNVHPNFRPADLYTYVGTGSVAQDQYGIMKDPKDAAPGGASWNDSFPDHTGNQNGYLYYCDAKEELNVFYAQKIDGLCEGIEYELSAWFAKTNAPDYFIDPNIKLIIGFTDVNDLNIGSIIETDTGSIEGIGTNRWHRGSLVFTAPPGTENIYFMLKNNVAGVSGNDLAIDDIEVRPCGPDIDVTNQIANVLINENDIICITDTSNSTIKLIANTPAGFAHQWQESVGNNVWTDIVGETLNILNYNIPLNPNPEHLIRLKFAHNNSNLNNSKCFFLSQEIKYSKTYSFKADDIVKCDNLEDGDDFNGIIQTFDLEGQTSTILGSQSPAEYTVTYHLSQSDADIGINSLSSPHENNLSPNSQAIFTRVLNNSTGCFNTNTTFNLIVIPLPTANPVSDLELCDNSDDGNNLNGIVQSFDLESQTNTILGAQPLSGFTVTYHLSQSDADAGINPLSSPYENSLNPNSQIIYTRILNNNTGCANSHLTFNAIVNTIPLATTASDLELCDDISDGDDTNGIVQTFDLENQTNTILGAQLASNFSVTYHLSHAEAIVGVNPLSSPHENSLSPNSETIYVRVLNNTTGCVNAESTFNLIINTLPIANNPALYSQCDDASNDGQAFFNLELDTIKEEINPNYITEGLKFSFYEYQTEAETIGIAIATPSNYQDAPGFTPETVWIRVENPNGCFRTVPLTLQVSPSSAALSAYNPNSIYQCDNGTDLRDGVSTFNLTPIKNYISSTVFSTFNVTVHFYESEIDAELETNEISDLANHQNTNFPNSQNIWVRVKSDFGNNCLGLEEFPNLLIVETLPTANPVTMPRGCDFDTSDTVLSHPFDTSQLESNILNGQNPADVNITYFDANAAPLLYSNATPVTSPIQPVFLTENQTITIRVTNNVTADPNGPCYDETTLEFVIDEQPMIANTVPNQVFCDDGNDATNENDGRHGFNTSSFESTIRGSQTHMTIYFNYLDENGVLITNSTTLPNPLVSGNQTISVEVVNPINPSCTATTNIDFIVNPLPNFTINEEEIVCSSDPTFTVILEPVQTNPSEIFNYEWVFEDGTILANTKTLQVSTPGDYTISLTNPITNCSKSRPVSVKSSELANIGLDDLEVNDLSENNTVTIKNPASLGAGTYEFSLESKDGKNIYPFQDSSVFQNVRAGLYTLLVKDDICGTVSIDISVVGYVKFFTPNGDGTNDTWQIKGISSSFQPHSTIFIYDRYGKLVKQLHPLEEGWNGTFNGSMMPSDDYWFNVLLEDGRTFMGHFALKL